MKQSKKNELKKKLGEQYLASKRCGEFPADLEFAFSYGDWSSLFVGLSEEEKAYFQGIMDGLILALDMEIHNKITTI